MNATARLLTLTFSGGSVAATGYFFVAEPDRLRPGMVAASAGGVAASAYAFSRPQAPK